MSYLKHFFMTWQEEIATPAERSKPIDQQLELAQAYLNAYDEELVSNHHELDYEHDCE